MKSTFLKYLLRCTLIVGLVGCLSPQGIAQTEAQGRDELLVEHQTDHKLDDVIHLNQRFRVYTDDHQKFTDSLKKVTDSSFVIGSQEVKFSSGVKLMAYSRALGAKRVKSFVRGGLWTTLIGIGVIALGLLVASLFAHALVWVGIVVIVFGSLYIFFGLMILLWSFLTLLSGEVPVTTFNLRGNYRLKRFRKP
jgi:hypothetical protein